jgi:glycosyltransferase involved in cell wall biosynthesis
MDISVILCTHNRSEYLAKALDSIAKSILSQSTTWEVLVVDNNSSDQTPETVKDFCRRYPNRFRYLFEPQPGKSYALNAAIRESQGAVLAFVDDDITVEPRWLERLAAPLRDSSWSGSGGPVILEWSCPPPKWLSSNFMAPLAGFDTGREAGETNELFGTNMAFRRTMFERYGVFRTDLGPSPNRETPRPNEDADFVRRLIAGGERLFYQPLAWVWHTVHSDRLRKRYFLDWWFDKGRADALMHGEPEDAKWHVGRMPLYLLRRFIIWTIRSMITIEPSERFSCRLRMRWLAGMIVGVWRSPVRPCFPEQASPRHIPDQTPTGETRWPEPNSWRARVGDARDHHKL